MKKIPILCFLSLVLCAALTMAQENPVPEKTPPAPGVTAPAPEGKADIPADKPADMPPKEVAETPAAAAEPGSADDEDVGELLSAGNDGWASDSGDTSYFEIELTRQSGFQKMPSFFGGGNFRRGISGDGPRKLAGTGTSGSKTVIGMAFSLKGLRYQVGRRYDKHLVAANFMMGSDLETGDNGKSDFIGGGVSYDYRLVSAQNVFSLALGVTGGFWYEEITTREYDPVRRIYRNDYQDEMYFGGPHLRAEAGYRWIVANYSLTMLIGTDVTLLYGIGFQLFLYTAMLPACLCFCADRPEGRLTGFPVAG
jgi:hypothetical protein